MVSLRNLLSFKARSPSLGLAGPEQITFPSVGAALRTHSRGSEMMHKELVLILAIVGTVVIGFVVIAHGWRGADLAAECELKCKPLQSRLVRDSERPPSAAGEAPLVCQCYDK